eukprot:3940550-Rhodomonas_salina.3
MLDESVQISWRLSWNQKQASIPPTVLPICYAISGTGIAHTAKHVITSTERLHPPTMLRIAFEILGTDFSCCAATRQYRTTRGYNFLWQSPLCPTGSVLLCYAPL